MADSYNITDGMPYYVGCTAVVETIETGVKLTLTDYNGTTEATVYDGVGITDLVYNDDYTVTITLADGRTFTTDQSVLEGVDRAEAAADNAEASETAAAASATAAAASAADAAADAASILGSVDAATDAAEAAADSATEASGYADNASTSATAAAGSASTASTHASAAAASATAAAGSATAAAGSAGSASGYATNASNSATAAAGSATSASNYASAASSSATAASGSATSASNYATTATNKASEASGYATTAATKAGEAAASAASAAESARTLTIDDTLSQSGQAADAKATGDAIKAKADPVGHYNDLASGTADQVISGNYVEESVPYFARQSGGGISVGNRECDEIVGGTVAFNQLVSNGNFVNANNWGTDNVSTSIADNVMTATATAASGAVGIHQSCSFKTGHKYLLSCGLKITSNSANIGMRFVLSNGGSGNEKGFSIPSNTQSVAAKIIDATDAWQRFYLIIAYSSSGISVGDKFEFSNFNIFDLTEMFGSTIANHIYSLETANAGAGVSLFRGLFPEAYYDTESAALESVEGVSAHVMRDADRNVIGNYPLDSSLTLRGVPKLSSDNKIYFDGDIYAADGTVTRKYGIVDMGTLNWQALSTNASGIVRMGAYLTGIKMAASGGAIANVICTKYNTGSNYNTYDRVDKTICVANSEARVIVYDSDYNTSSAEASFKTALSGVYLVYELELPTTEEAEPYQNVQVVDASGTEEYVTTGIVPVGHNTKYPEDFVKKLDNLPSDFSNLIAPTETSTTASQNYEVGSYLIYNNTLYKVTSAIASGGTITIGTNVSATTIMAELRALQ